MVECLHGQWYRPFLADRPSTRIGDSRAHLDQTVEPTAPCPRAGPPVGVEAHIDQSGAHVVAHVVAQAEAVERTGAVSVDEHIGGPEQLEEAVPSLGHTQIEAGTTLAQGDLGGDRRLIPIGRVDPQHLRPPSGEQPGGHRPGQHPGEVEHPEPVEGLVSQTEMGLGTVGGRRPIHVHERLVCDRPTLGMTFPVVERAHGCRCPAGGDDRGLQLLGRPGAHGCRNCRTALWDSEHTHGGGSMMGGVGVQSDPPVIGGVVPGHRVPGGWQIPTLRPDRGPEPGRRQIPVDGHVRRITTGAQRDQRSQRGPGGGHGGLGQVTHGEDRAEGPAVRQGDRWGGDGSAERPLELGQKLPPDLGHGSIVGPVRTAVNLDANVVAGDHGPTTWGTFEAMPR
jgi:hypothetical protein